MVRAVAAILWASLAQVMVGVYLVSTVTPGLTSSNFFSSYDVVPLWVIGALAAAAATFVSVFRFKWRPTAGAMAAVYILLRAVYVELVFGARAPWSSFLLSLALAVSIAWSWGRPPIIKRQVFFR